MSAHPVFHTRAEVIEHLTEIHDWRDSRVSAMDGSVCPNPLGWITPQGEYLRATSELLATHRELHAVDEGEGRSAEGRGRAERAVP